MSNKRKKSKSVRTITKSQKALYGAIFGGLFAILIVFVLNISGIYKLLYKPKGYLYVEPTFAAFAVLCVFIGIGLFLAIYFYGSFMDKRKTLKQVKQRAKMILPIYLVLAIVISVFCYSSFNYIDDIAYGEKSLFATREILSNDDIKKINIYVLNAPILPTKGRSIIEYSIACELISENDERIIDSSYFYSYQYMYDYLSGLNATVEADRYKLDNLIEYQRRPVNFSAENVNENIEYINKIFDLENRGN